MTEKKFFTPEQKEKLAKLADYYGLEFATSNLFYLSSEVAKAGILDLCRFMDKRKFEAFYDKERGEDIESIGKAFVALHILKTIYMQDNYERILAAVQKAADTEINRQICLIEKENEES